MTAMSVALQAPPATQRRLRVLLDARKIGDGGIGTYLENLISGLSSHPRVDLSVVCSGNKRRFLPDVPLSSVIDSPYRSYSWGEYFRFARRLDQSTFDLLHVPHFTLPYGISIPTVVTIHDLIHLRAPERFFYPWVAGPMIRSSLARATGIVTVSETSRRDILNYVDNNPRIAAKLHVIPNSIPPSFGGKKATEVPALSEPYVLGVFSNAKPHKQLDRLIEAFRSFKNKSGCLAEGSLGSRLKLVLVGPGSQEIMPVHADIVCCGVLSAEDLHSTYCNAQAIVVSSLIEGFCFPALEAHVCGVPVISTPAPAVLELLGPDDVVCRDFGVAGIEEGIRRFVERVELSGKPRIAHIPADLERFSVGTVTAQTVDVYQACVKI